MSHIKEKLEAARLELLDFSMRNPLLNYRLLKSKGVKIVDENPGRVFNLLANENRKLAFLAQPEKVKEGETVEEEDPSELAFVTEIDLDQPEQSLSRSEYTLQTDHVESNLQRRLLQTYYAAKTYIEEQGVNILYLALGFLEWFESPNSDVKRLAPLVLVPVRLDRTSAQARFRIQFTEDDIIDNLSLRAKLHQDFGLTLPDLPDDLEAINLESYFEATATTASKSPQWQVLGWFPMM